MQLANGFTTNQIASSITHRRLELTILPTEKCNFRCTYCYEDFLIGKMPERVQLGLENLISKRAPDLEQLSLNWFGGEPLLASSVILRIANFARMASDKYGFILDGSMTTNAYHLTADLLAKLVELKHDFFQITLDGWKDGHDETRRRADGKGTFDRIWNNIVAARNSRVEFEFQLRIHVTQTNRSSLETLCQNLGRLVGGDSRFRLDFQDVRNMGGSNGKNIQEVPPETFHAVSLDLLDIFHQSSPSGSPASPRPFVDIAANTRNEKANSKSESASRRRAYEKESAEPYICYAAKPNFFLIRADGRIGKCTVALNDERNQIGSLNHDGTMTFDHSRMQKWYQGFESLDVDTLGCPIQSIKMGVPDHTRATIPVTVVA